MSKELGRVYGFDPQVYPRKLWVAVGGDIGTLRASFCQNDGEQLDFKDIDRFSATTTAVKEKETGLFGELIWFPKRSDMCWDYIAHEATHAAMDIFGDIGIVPDVNNQEPLAYLIGWISDCIYNVKRGNNGKSTK